MWKEGSRLSWRVLKIYFLDLYYSLRHKKQLYKISIKALIFALISSSLFLIDYQNNYWIAIRNLFFFSNPIIMFFIYFNIGIFWEALLWSKILTHEGQLGRYIEQSFIGDKKEGIAPGEKREYLRKKRELNRTRDRLYEKRHNLKDKLDDFYSS